MAMMDIDIDVNQLLDEAYQRGAIEGYRRGREDAAIALTDLAHRDECRYVRTDWVLFDDGMPQVPDRWVAATYAVNAARGDL